MSPSTRSKSASPSSPATGDAPPEGDTDDLPAARVVKTAGPAAVGPEADNAPLVAEVELEMSRQRLIGWTIFGTLIGSLLVWKLGTVGVWVGVGLVILGVFRGYQLVQTFRHPPGTIRVTEGKVSLPRGICMARPVEVPPAEITAVYFLRRSVPWNRSAPVLVVEIGSQALAYPRDWFASEADQRHVVHALLRGRKLEPSDPADADPPDAPAEAGTAPA